MKHVLSVLAILPAVAAPAAVRAQAFCALRDPVKHIYGFFPESNGYRSIVREITEDTRADVAGALPFPLHHNELGKHTLYVALKDTRPIGIVHVRSEKSRWGLVEIAWALKLDLGVHGVQFQRCRSPHRKTVENSMRSWLRGKTLDEMLALHATGAAIPGLADDEAVELGQAALRSALKTRVVTSSTWKSDLEELVALAFAHDAFAGTRKIGRIPAPAARLAAQSTGTPVGQWQARDENGRVLGCLVAMTVDHGDSPVNVLFAFDRDGIVRGAQAPAADATFRQACRALVGKPVDPHTGDTPARAARQAARVASVVLQD